MTASKKSKKPTVKKKAVPPVIDEKSEIKKGRLRKLSIKNFRAIGAKGVDIELDDIVVLVGPNNAGKSSILRAYELLMSDGSKEGHLIAEDFPNSKLPPESPVEFLLETEVDEGEPGEEWVGDKYGKLWCEGAGEKIVRERWTWTETGAGKRSGYNVKTCLWDDKVPWGAPNVAKARRPEPHPVRAFDSPEDQTKQIHNLLRTAVIDHAKELKDEAGNSIYQKLLEDLKVFQEKAVEASNGKVEDIEKRLSDIIAEIFLDHSVEFKQSAAHSEKCISLFPVNGQLTMGPKEGYKSTLEFQGSGARRTMLWAALKLLSEEKSQNSRPHVLLIDEPELCLHPDAVREACKVLYNLAGKNGWQVMVTTHSPVFIDLSRDNSSVVRVERVKDGDVKGTTLYRPVKAQLDENDKANLKLLNIYDPYVAEFFFGGRIVIVEGDTEYSAFRFVINKFPKEFGDVQIIRARGKSTIIAVTKILNQFGTSYSILHDSDKPTCFKKNKKTGAKSEIVNPAWTTNENILAGIAGLPNREKIRLVASKQNFELAFFDTVITAEKPYSTIKGLNQNTSICDAIITLLKGLVDHTCPLPPQVLEWKTIEELKTFVEAG